MKISVLEILGGNMNSDEAVEILLKVKHEMTMGKEYGYISIEDCRGMASLIKSLKKENYALRKSAVYFWKKCNGIDK